MLFLSWRVGVYMRVFSIVRQCNNERVLTWVFREINAELLQSLNLRVCIEGESDRDREIGIYPYMSENTSAAYTG